MRESAAALLRQQSTRWSLFLALWVVLVVVALLLPHAISARVLPPEEAHEGRSRIARRSVAATTNVSCPLDFSILTKYTWINQACGPGTNTSTCCVAALSGIGLATSKYLRETGYFELPDMATTLVCLDEYQAQLDEIGVQRNVVTECSSTVNSTFSAAMFTRSPKLCLGIETVNDFRNKVGPSPVDTACQYLPDHGQCIECVSAMESLIGKLTSDVASNDAVECFDFVVIYAAGIVNVAGPWDEETAQCILAVRYNPPASNRTGLFIGLGAAGAALISIDRKSVV